MNTGPDFGVSLEPVIIMSFEDITVIPNTSQMKFGPIQISKNEPNWQ